MGSVEPTKQANLKSICLAGLLAGDVDTVNDLVQSCKENGFFYLDLRDAATCKMLKQADDLVGVGKSVFQLSLEEKEEYSTEKYLPSRLLGYVALAVISTLISNHVASNEPVVLLARLLRRKTATRAFRYVFIPPIQELDIPKATSASIVRLLQTNLIGHS